MELQDRIRAMLQGRDQEHQRRAALLAALLEAADRGGLEGLTAEVDRWLDDLGRDADDHLEALQRKL
jgi:hypothetical protein